MEMAARASGREDIDVLETMYILILERSFKCLVAIKDRRESNSRRWTRQITVGEEVF